MIPVLDEHASVDGNEVGFQYDRMFEETYSGSTPARAWDVLSDGRFVFVQSGPQREREHEIFPDRIRIVQNWASSLD